MLRVTNKEYFMFEHGPKIWLFDTIKELTKFWYPYVMEKEVDDIIKSSNVYKVVKHGNRWEMIKDDRFYLEIMYQGEKLGIVKKFKKKEV